MAEYDEEDLEDLNILMKQKQSRPSYTRVISHELTRSQEEIEETRRNILQILETLKVFMWQDHPVHLWHKTNLAFTLCTHPLIRIEQKYTIQVRRMHGPYPDVCFYRAGG